MSVRRALTVTLLTAMAPGCAANSSLLLDHPPNMAAVPSAGLVFVMEPIIVGTASPGNAGRDFVEIKANVANRTLSIVRERFRGAAIADSRPLPGPLMPAGYQLATGERAVTMEERSAADRAYRCGATHLLVPSITEWKQMRTDDPIGALILPHNTVTVTLRLMRLQPPTLVGRVTFHNRARLTLNQKASRLLDDGFRQAVLQLVSASSQQRAPGAGGAAAQPGRVQLASRCFAIDTY
jgi:hypothetical protein